jgi:DnaK suppressor protein
LLPMELETLARIDRSLAWLDEGNYGRCLDCEQEISEPRLRALPFAVRCRTCEVERERAGRRAPNYLEGPGGLFTNWVGF